MSRLELRLLGGFEARLNGEALGFPTRQGELLLAYLALDPDKPHAREKIAALFWGDRSDAQARVSLRQVLYRIRQALAATDPFPLEIDARFIRLNSRAIWCDLAELQAADPGNPEQLAAAVDLCRGDLLEGLSAPDAEAETWLLSERNRVRKIVSERFRQLSELLRSQKRIPEMEVLARRRLTLDAFDEEAIRHVMTACALQGRRNAALEAFRAFSDRLRSDLAIAPDQDTVALFRAIRSGEFPAAIEAESAASTEILPDMHRQAKPPSLDSRSCVEADAERRYITVLHVLLPGLAAQTAGADPETAAAISSAVLKQIERVASEHGGKVVRAAGDEVVAVFGAASEAEDHFIRAGRAALTILEAAKRSETDLAPRIGLHAGEAVIASAADPGPVGLVARAIAQAAADSAVILTEPVHRLCEGYFEFTSGPDVTLAGLSAPQNTFRLLKRTDARSSWQARARRRLSRLVGREGEISELKRTLERTAGGASIAVITGEAGMGKSRLVHEFLALPEIAGTRVLHTGVAAFDVEATHSALGTLVRAWAGIAPEDGQEQAWRKTVARLAGYGESINAILPALRLLLDVPQDDPAWSVLTASQQRHRVINAIRTILDHESRAQPIIVVFEDAHWIDAETAHVLDGLVDSLGAARVLLVVTCRPEFRHAWGGKSFVRQIRLEPLPGSEAELLSSSLFGQSADLEPLRHMVREKAGGVPLFIEEIARDLVESGILTGAPGAYSMRAPYSEMAIPASVRGVIAARIERLPADQKRVLQVASVIGVQVPEALLAPLCEMDRDALDAALRALAGAELLYQTRGLPNAEFAFKHALTRDVAYRSLLIARRETLHARLLDLCEAYYADRRGEHVERLAHHARLSAVWDRAADYLTQAGDRAVERSAYPQAWVFYERALDALRRLPATDRTRRDAITLRLKMRPVVTATGEYARLCDDLSEAEELARTLGDPALLTTVQLHVSYLNSTMGRFDTALAASRAARESAAKSGDAATMREADLATAQALRLRGHSAEVIALLEPSVRSWTEMNRHHRGGQTGTRSVWCLGHLSAAYGARGVLDMAEHMADQALEIAQETRRPVDLQFAMLHRGAVRLLQDRPKECIPDLEEALAIVASAQLSAFRAWIATTLAEAYLRLGQTEQAHRLLLPALDKARADLQAHFAARVEIALSKAERLLGRPDGAEAHARSALRWADAAADRRIEVPALRRLAAALWAREQAGEAQKAALKAISRAEEYGFRPELVRCLKQGAEILEASDGATAAELKARAETISRNASI